MNNWSLDSAVHAKRICILYCDGGGGDNIMHSGNKNKSYMNNVGVKILAWTTCTERSCVYYYLGH
uniref:Uncharacterized protein n=1 Tax=Glossina pallidipes TaxID=7398 RepID=A0A1A9ZQP6_GLOPL